jgi:hypothetical protein
MSNNIVASSSFDFLTADSNIEKVLKLITFFVKSSNTSDTTPYIKSLYKKAGDFTDDVMNIMIILSAFDNIVPFLYIALQIYNFEFEINLKIPKNEDQLKINKEWDKIKQNLREKSANDLQFEMNLRENALQLIYLRLKILSLYPNDLIPEKYINIKERIQFLFVDSVEKIFPEYIP